MLACVCTDKLTEQLLQAVGTHVFVALISTILDTFLFCLLLLTCFLHGLYFLDLESRLYRSTDHVILENARLRTNGRISFPMFVVLVLNQRTCGASFSTLSFHFMSVSLASLLHAWTSVRATRLSERLYMEPFECEEANIPVCVGTRWHESVL